MEQELKKKYYAGLIEGFIGGLFVMFVIMSFVSSFFLQKNEDWWCAKLPAKKLTDQCYYLHSIFVKEMDKYAEYVGNTTGE